MVASEAAGYVWEAAEGEFGGDAGKFLLGTFAWKKMIVAD